MTLSELIIACGDENVRFQNLDQSAISLDWSRKAGGRITFGTGQTIIPGEGTEQLGLVVWLDREAVAVAIASNRSPPGASPAERSARPRDAIKQTPLGVDDSAGGGK